MADKIGYHNTIIDITTGAGKEATITVYDVNTSDLSTIYSDPAGTAKDNPFTTDANGRFSFYADQGKYDIQVSGTGIITYKLEDVPIVASYAITSKPASGEYRIKALRLASDGKSIIVTHSSAAES